MITIQTKVCIFLMQPLFGGKTRHPVLSTGSFWHWIDWCYQIGRYRPNFWVFSIFSGKLCLNSGKTGRNIDKIWSFSVKFGQLRSRRCDKKSIFWLRIHNLWITPRSTIYFFEIDRQDTKVRPKSDPLYLRDATSTAQSDKTSRQSVKSYPCIP